MPRPHASDAPNPFAAGARPAHAAGMRLARLLFEWIAAARTRAELRRLSERTLRDIGLARGDIDALFR